MKTGIFVEGLSNVTRFMDATRTVERRGAREASWMLAEGEPGYGKTRTLQWYAVPRTPVFLRAKAGWTPHWLLTDLAAVLNVTPARSTEKLFNAVLPELLVRQCALVVDEIDHAARDVRVLETLRDLTDAAEIPLIAGGMKGARGLMKRFPQIYSRVADIVTFGPASVSDVGAICATLSEVKIAGDLAAEVQKRTAGRLREVMNAIARIEAFGRKARGEVTLEMWGNRPLVNDDRPRLVHAQDAA